MDQAPQKKEFQTKKSNVLSIRDLSKQVKIRDLDNLKELKTALSYCFKLTGLNQLPGESEIKMLLDFIVFSYGGLNHKEIMVAFNYGCSKKFECEMNHYQNFSCEYLGRVLKAYNNFRSKELAKTQSKQLTDFKEAQIDRKQYFELHLFMKYDALLNGKYIFTEEDELLLYRKLTEGLKIKVATIQEKKDAIEDADKSIQKKYREDQNEREKKVKSKAKRICFKNWVNRMAFEEIDLRTEINKLI